MNESGKVSASHVALYEKASADGMSTNFGGPILKTQMGHLCNRNRTSKPIVDLELTERLDIRTPLRCKTNLQRKPSLSFKDFSDRMSSDGADNIEYIAGIDSVTSHFVSFNLNSQVRKTSNLLGLHVGRALHSIENTDNSITESLENGKVISVQAQADVGSDTGNEFLHAQFDWLCKTIGV